MTQLEMVYYRLVAVLVFIVLLVRGTETMTIDPYVIIGDQCNDIMQRADAIEKIRDSVKVLLYSDYESNAIENKCGDGLWYLIASLNMTDPSEQCPSAWREYNTSGIRACGRPVTSIGSCSASTYSTSHPYSKVCGRVIGYQVASPDAFNTQNNSIDLVYVDGISITHGSPREHIWTYVAGFTELHWLNSCPCMASSIRQPPSFVGNHYYCETAKTTSTLHRGQLYADDKLWDGERCEREGSCCTNKTLPWFSVELSNRTTDDIEVRICGSEETDNEDTPIELLEIYVQ